MYDSNNAPAMALRYEPAVRRSRKVARFLGAVWVLTLVEVAVLWDRNRDNLDFVIGLPVCWGAFAFTALRFSRRRVVLDERGLVLHAVLGRRRVPWADVTGARITHRRLVPPRKRMYHAPAHNWRVGVATRHGGVVALPGFTHVVRPDYLKDETRAYGAQPPETAYSTPPSGTPAELVGAYTEFRTALTRFRGAAPAGGDEGTHGSVQ